MKKLKGGKRISVNEDPAVENGVCVDFVIIGENLLPVDDEIMLDSVDELPEGSDEDFLYETYRDDKIENLKRNCRK